MAATTHDADAAGGIVEHDFGSGSDSDSDCDE